MKDNKPIVLMDLDDTVLDFKKAEAAAFYNAMLDMGIPADSESLSLYSEINLEQWRRLEKGLATRDEILINRFVLLFERLGVKADAARTRDLYEVYLGQGHEFMPGARELLEELSPEYDLYIVSNGTASVQASRIEASGIGTYFRDIFVSEELGANKPDREFFDRCFQRIPGFERERAVLVGDSLSSDILGGINSGLRTVWFNYRGQPESELIRPDFCIEKLSDLPPILAKILT